MCGRTRFSIKAAEQLINVVNSKNNQSRNVSNNQNISLKENLSPGMNCSVITNKNSNFEIEEMIWGLIPSYSPKNHKIDHYVMFNKRTDALQSHHFKNLVSHNRCVFIVDGFYEWTLVAGKKHPHYVYLNEPMNIAGIYDSWENSEGVAMKTFAVLTCDSCAKFKSINLRQPVMLSNSELYSWLNESASFVELLQFVANYEKQLLEQQPSEHFVNKQLKYHAVASKVTNQTYQGDDCSKKIEFGMSLMKYFIKNNDEENKKKIDKNLGKKKC
jgi:putative SOS response-associated peptidase YedK